MFRPTVRALQTMYHPFVATLVSAQPVSPTTRRMRFATEELRHDTISSVFARMPAADGSIASSLYTPITTKATGSHFEILVKRNDAGTVSRQLHALGVGERVPFAGPHLHTRYTPGEYGNVGLIAGGTGVTPFIQLLREGLGNPKDATRFWLVYAAASESEVLLKDELDALATETGRLRILYVVETAGPEWGGGLRGRVTQEALWSFLPPATDDTHILVCGPEGLTNAVCGDQNSNSEGFLQRLGYLPLHVFRFDAH
eukprot:TRINITY_DN4146_c0_g1_i1.p1 TRINITY_DN4146_c0_g1~~TRINITY_DN4146_c0_g1_i1.p1  ORF type:complete len:269 (+),score=49.36 TRINITY_DN4146_c0_g1_i1:38-808(+)